MISKNVYKDAARRAIAEMYRLTTIMPKDAEFVFVMTRDIFNAFWKYEMDCTWSWESAELRKYCCDSFYIINERNSMLGTAIIPALLYKSSHCADYLRRMNVGEAVIFKNDDRLYKVEPDGGYSPVGLTCTALGLMEIIPKSPETAYGKASSNDLSGTSIMTDCDGTITITSGNIEIVFDPAQQLSHESAQDKDEEKSMEDNIDLIDEYLREYRKG